MLILCVHARALVILCTVLLLVLCVYGPSRMFVRSAFPYRLFWENIEIGACVLGHAVLNAGNWEPLDMLGMCGSSAEEENCSFSHRAINQLSSVQTSWGQRSIRISNTSLSGVNVCGCASLCVCMCLNLCEKVGWQRLWLQNNIIITKKLKTYHNLGWMCLNFHGICPKIRVWLHLLGLCKHACTFVFRLGKLSLHFTF